MILTDILPALLYFGFVLWLALAGSVLLAALIHGALVSITESIGDMIE